MVETSKFLSSHSWGSEEKEVSYLNSLQSPKPEPLKFTWHFDSTKGSFRNDGILQNFAFLTMLLNLKIEKLAI